MTILDKLRQGVISGNPEYTEELGARLAATLPRDCALALQGDLGSGKTTFTRGLAQGIGVESSVTSPTYNIFTIHTGRRQLVHMDAYRLQGVWELESLAIQEILRQPFLIAVEWPENIREFFLDFNSFWLVFEILQDHTHKITLRE